MSFHLSHLALKIAQRALLSRAHLEALRYQLEREPLLPAQPPDGRTVRVGVVQLEGQLFARAADYAAHITKLCRQALKEGAQLLVFPEDTGSYPLAGLIPFLERLLAKGGAGAPGEAVRQGQAPVLTLFRVLAPAARAVYQLTFSTLARLGRVHILAGSTLALNEAGQVYKEAHLYGPEGTLLLAQRKTHLFPTEALWGLSRGDDIHVVATPCGRLAAPICMDHTYFEPIRIAWLKGAEIIVDPAADAARYNFYTQARGVWSRVQESPAYGIHCLMVGRILGTEFGGRSGIYAPLALTPQRDGIIAQARTGDTEEVFCATLDLEPLRHYRSQYSSAFNLALYRRYLPAVYANERQALVHPASH